MKLRVLLWDVETKYITFRGWRTGKQFVSHEQIIEGCEPDIICIGYKWLGEKETRILDWGLKSQDSTAMIEEFRKVIESADIAIGHNSDSFDTKQINTQLLLKQLDPIAWPSSEDTLKQFRKYFYLPSYSLDYISKLLTGSGKSIMTFNDWIQIVENKSRKHLDKMRKYCKRDVTKLEADYKRAVKYMKPKIHAGIVNGNGKESCPRCGSLKRFKNGFIFNTTGRWQRLRCMGCAHIYKTKP